eukprot:1393702-Amorphochlora_amoeboformis.AAC.1
MMHDGKKQPNPNGVGFGRTSGKENIVGKPPLGNSMPLSPKEPKHSAEGKNKPSSSADGEKNTKKDQSFFVGNFGSTNWRASPLMQDYMRSKSVLEVKKDIMSSLRSASVPRASDLRQQRSKITPPPFGSTIGNSGSTFDTKESRKSTPSPLGISWADVSPFTAKRRQGQGSAPPWSGIKAEESWHKAAGSSASRTPSPQNFIGPPLPFFSRSPPKIAVSAGKKVPKSDTRPQRSQSSLVQIRRLNRGGLNDAKFPSGYNNFRSLTPTSLLYKQQKVTHLKSIAQRLDKGSVAAQLGLDKKREAKKVSVPPLSGGGAFKAVHRPSRPEESVSRVHELSKSLQKMGLGGQQSDGDVSGLVSNKELMGVLKMPQVSTSEKVPAKIQLEEEKQVRAQNRDGQGLGVKGLPTSTTSPEERIQPREQTTMIPSGMTSTAKIQPASRSEYKQTHPQNPQYGLQASVAMGKHAYNVEYENAGTNPHST